MQSLFKERAHGSRLLEETPRQDSQESESCKEEERGGENSTAAAAIESEGEDIIWGAIECNKIIFEPLGITEGYHTISLKEKNYVYFSDNKDSLDDKDGKDKGKDGGNTRLPIPV
jgi:hypothetical protein